MTAKQIYLAAALAGCTGLGFSVSEWRWQNRCVIQGVRFSDGVHADALRRLCYSQRPGSKTLRNAQSRLACAVELMADANDCLIRNNLFLGGFGMVLPRPTL